MRIPVPSSLVCSAKSKFQVALLFLLAFMQPWSSWAGLLPVFNMDAACWYSTDVVVVDEGEVVDGRFEVLEVWRGPLKIGDKLFVPELAQYTIPGSKQISTTWVSKDHLPFPPFVTARRMILFLRPNLKKQEPWNEWLEEEWAKNRPEPRTSSQQQVRWGPASQRHHGFQTSTLWIENGIPFGFTQRKNPGPLQLTRIGAKSESEIKISLNLVINCQDLLHHASKELISSKRIKLLVPLIQASNFLGGDEAMAMLIDCGPEAMESLNTLYKSPRNYLNDSTILDAMQEIIVNTFGKSDDRETWESFSKWFVEELEFWVKDSPVLQVGWWDGQDLSEEKMKKLKQRWTKMNALLKAFNAYRLRHRIPSAPLLVRFTEFWKHLPYNSDSARLSRVGVACKNILEMLKTTTISPQ